MAIAAAGNTTLALTGDGGIVGWGDNSRGQLNIPADLRDVRVMALGPANGFAITRDGSFVQWGNLPITLFLSPTLKFDNIEMLTATARSAWALDGSSMVTSWGETAPFPDYGFVSVAAGGSDNSSIYDYVLKLRFDGSLGYSGIFPTSTPYIPVSPTNVAGIAASLQHAAVLIGDGSPLASARMGDRTVATGSTVLLSSGIAGLHPLTFQWQLNGTNIGDATNAVMILTNVPLSAAGQYSCVAINARGSVTNGPGTLSVVRSIPQFGETATAIDSAGNFRMHVSGLSGHGEVVIYASTNLINWEPTFTNPPILGILQFTDTGRTNWPQRFYRIEER